jgi:hypothetical protein
MAANRETTMCAGEGPCSGGVNPMLETRVLDWILSDSDEGPSSGEEEHAGEGAEKWVRGVPQVCANYKEVLRERRRRCRGPHL